MSKIPKKWWKQLILKDKIFWITCENSMRFLGKMWLMIILKVAKKQRFTLSLENTFLEKPHKGERGSNWPFLSLLRVNMGVFNTISDISGENFLWKRLKAGCY